MGVDGNLGVQNFDPILVTWTLEYFNEDRAEKLVMHTWKLGNVDAGSVAWTAQKAGPKSPDPGHTRLAEIFSAFFTDR